MTATYSDATETTDGLESAADKTSLDNLTTNNWSYEGISSSAASGTYSGVLAYCQYIERAGIVFAQYNITCSSNGVGSGSGELVLALPIAANSANIVSATALAVDYVGSASFLAVYQVNSTTLHVRSFTNSNAIQNNSDVKFLIVYQAAS